MSQIRQTADEIKLEVGNTGIDITNGLISLSADNTVIDNNVKVGALETISNNSRVKIEGGIAEFFGVTGIANIRVGLDSQGCAMLNFYDNNGNYVYGLGPNDLPQQLNSKASAFAATEMIRLYNIAEIENTHGNVSNMAALSAGFSVFYLFVEGYSALSNVKTYLVSKTTTPSAYNQKTYDSNEKSGYADDWYPVGAQIAAGYYIGEEMPNGSYSGASPNLYKCRNVYQASQAGSPVIFIGVIYYIYQDLKAQLTNSTGTVVYPFDSTKMIINYLNGNAGVIPRE
jgi:hypothetical protein